MRSSIQLNHLQELLKDSKAIQLCAEQCNVIGDETKLKICFLLKHYPELDVTQISNLVGASVSNTSHALSKLKAVGLVASRKKSRYRYYYLKNEAFENILSIIGNKSSTGKQQNSKYRTIA